MGVSLSGIFSGINSDSIISQLIAADSKPMQLLQAQVTTDQSKESAEQSIAASLTQLQSAANALTGAQNLNNVTASSSNTQFLTATASSAASQGTHTVVIHQLASSAQEIQAGVIQKDTWKLNQEADSADSQLLSAADLSGGTNFVFQFGSEAAVTVDLSAYAATGITLNQLVGAVNSAAGYTAASAIQNGDGEYQLQLRAQDAGTGLGLTIPAGNSVAALSSIGQFTQTVKGVAGVDTLVGAGVFVYTYHGTTRTIQTTAKTTLGNLQDLINNDASNPGVSASILDHKVDDDHEFHLVLSGQSTGTNYGITVNSSTTLAGFGPGTADWTQSQQPKDSQIQVDGYPATGWLQRSSNNITDVIPGVTLNLTGLSPDGITVTVNQDTSRLVANLQGLVSAYNSAYSTIGQYTSYDSTNQKGGLLQGDTNFVDLLDGVRQSLLTALGGSSSFSVAAQLGFSIDKTGKLSLDTTVLSDALSKDYKGVLNLIGAQNSGQSDSSMIQFGGATAGTVAGNYEVQVSFDSGGNITSAQIRPKGLSAWTAATVKGGVISGAKGTPEEGLTLQASWDGASTTQSANVSVFQGLATHMGNSLNQDLDTTTGVLATWKTGMDAQIKSLNSNISDMQAQLDQEQTNLQNEFVQLETTLAQLDEQLQAIKSLSATTSSTTSTASTNAGTGSGSASLSSSSSSISNSNNSYTPSSS